MSTEVTVTRLMEKVKALEARVEELERFRSDVRGSVESHIRAHEQMDASSYSDQEIVERWKAGGCVLCGGLKERGYQYLCAACAIDTENDDPREVGRLIDLCDAAVKEGK